MHALTLRPLAARDRHTPSIRPGQGGHVRRAMRRHLIYAVAGVVLGCSGTLDVHPTSGPDVAGTWSGSAPGVTLTVALGSSVCEFGCGGSVTGGTYSDSATNEHGTFTSGASSYLMNPPGNALYSSPLPGWTISMSPVDTANSSVSITFSGTFSTSTAVTGYVKFTHGAATDSVTLTLAKQ